MNFLSVSASQICNSELKIDKSSSVPTQQNSPKQKVSVSPSAKLEVTVPSIQQIQLISEGVDSNHFGLTGWLTLSVFICNVRNAIIIDFYHISLFRVIFTFYVVEYKRHLATIKENASSTAVFNALMEVLHIHGNSECFSSTIKYYDCMLLEKRS